MGLAYIFTAAIMVLSLIIQGHPSFDALRIGGVKPDLMFIAIVYFGYSFGSFYGETTGFIGGLFHDSVSHSDLGLLTLPKVIVGFVVGMIGRGVIRSNIVTIFILLFASSIIKGVITLLLSMIFHNAALNDITGVILPEAFYNALLAPFLFKIYDKIFESEIEEGGNY